MKQGELLPVPVPASSAAVVLAADESRVCTAARLLARRPADYARAVALLAEGAPVFQISRLLGVSPNTIYAIRRRECGEVERHKQSAADKFADLADAAADAAAERLADPDARARIPFQHLMIGAGVAVDKSQLLSGGATARIEIARDDGSEFDRLIREAEAVQIDLVAPSATQKGEAFVPGGQGVQPELPGVPGYPGAPDTQSGGNGEISQ